jgi:hypothetical protein
MSDRLTDALNRVDELASSEAPDALIERARAESTTLRQRTCAGKQKWVALAAGILALILAASFTPPGRAATEWVGDLVGVGDVGGPPTRPSEVRDFGPASDQIVLATGETADGVAFEIVAFRSDKQIVEREEQTVCVNVEFPGRQSDPAGSCYAGALRYGALCCSGVIFKDAASSVPRIEGEVHPDVDRVVISYVDESGAVQSVDATVGMITPEFAERLNIDHPSGLFIASLPGLAEQRGLPTPLQGSVAHPIEVTAFGAEGQELETEAIHPVSDRQIQRAEELNERRDAFERFRSECSAADEDELSDHCQALLDEVFD